ncbi:MAG: hypothetical protein AMXMBFR4_23570 [Candidatus Hydrogenedentota bacterium]
MTARTVAMRSARSSYAVRSVRRNAKQLLMYALAAACATAALVGLYQHVMESGRYRVKTIRIDGARLLSSEQIVQAAGVTNADHILFLNTARIAERVRCLPYVKDCTVRRTFPDMVTIAIAERTPVATIIIHNHPFEIDAEMKVLRELDLNEPHIGPLISQIPELGDVGTGAQLQQASLRTALDVWSAFSQTDMASEVTVSEIAAPGPNSIRMYCDELPFEIRWGREDVPSQAKRLDILWRQKGKSLACSEYLDLRFGRDIACK